MPSSTSNSETAYPPVKTTFFDPETVDRPVPARPWRVILFVSLIALLVFTAIWEVYWRGKGFVANDFKNSSSLWTQERRKAVGDATVLIGSSRIYYDVDLDHRITEEDLATLLDGLLEGLPETGAKMPEMATLDFPGGTTVIPFDTPQSVARFFQPGIAQEQAFHDRRRTRAGRHDSRGRAARRRLPGAAAACGTQRRRRIAFR